MPKSGVIDGASAPRDETANAPLQGILAGAAAGVTPAASPSAVPATVQTPSATDAAPQSGDSDAPAGGMSRDTQSGVEVTAPPSSSSSTPQRSQGDELERAKALAKLKIIDWVRQQTRDDPVSLALKMPYLQSRLKAWEDAKASGDAGAMTKTYNDLLRGIEAEQNRRGIPKEQQRVLSNDLAEDVARDILNAPPEKMLETLRNAKEQHGEYAEGLMKQIAHFMPQALRTADSHSSKLMGELIWRKAVASAGPDGPLPAVSESWTGALNVAPTLDLFAPVVAPNPEFESAERQATDPASAEQAPKTLFDSVLTKDGTQPQRLTLPSIFPQARPPKDPRPPRLSGPRERRDPIELDWSARATRERLRSMRDEPLTVLTMLHLAYESYNRDDDPRTPQQRLQDAGWEVLPIQGGDDPRTGYYAFALYNAASKTVIIINRGSEDTDDKLSTAAMKWRIPVAQLDNAATFLRQVQQYILTTMQSDGRQVRNCLAIGHSLGGTLAEYQMMLSRNDNGFARVPKFSAITFAAARARATLEARMPYHLGHRPMISTDALSDFAVDYTMPGDGIALGQLLQDGTQDERNRGRDHVGRTYLLDGIDMETLYWLRTNDRDLSSLNTINLDNHYMRNYRSKKGLLRTPVGQVIVGYDGSRRVQ